jgi:hypothetical protein
MKLIRILFISTILFTNSVSAQVVQRIAPINSVIKDASFLGKIHMEALSLGISRFTNANTINGLSNNDLDTLLLIPNHVSTEELYIKNRGAIRDALRSITISTYVMNDRMFAFGIKNISDTCIFLGSYSFDKIFNTLRTDERERAKIVVSKLLMPIAHDMYPSLKGTKFRFLALCGCYVKSDFSSSYPNKNGCEVTCLIDLSLFKKFYDLEMTEDELLKHTEIFIADDTDIKKIELFE